MNAGLRERYDSYDIAGKGKWEVLTPRPFRERVMALFALEAHLNKGRPVTEDFSVHPDFTDQERELIFEAKDFVEHVTGRVVNCTVDKVDSPNEGQYLASLHTIYMPPDVSGSSYGMKSRYGSTLVHEMVHSVTIDVSSIITLEPSSGMVSTVRIGPFDTNEVTPAYAPEDFFFEALAEFISGQWREHCDENLRNRERELMKVSDSVSLPARFLEADVPVYVADSNTTMMTSLPGFAAFGVQLMSEYTGTDLVGLMIKALDPMMANDAVQQLRHEVDSIEPGLFSVLASAEYTDEDFTDCLEIIKQAIANQAHEQHRIQI